MEELEEIFDKPSSLSDVSPFILNAIRFISANCWGSGAPRPASTDSITALKPSPKQSKDDWIRYLWNNIDTY
jgi:hypothetical protein